MKKKSISITVFGYENEEKRQVFVSRKCCVKKHVDILLVEEKTLCSYQKC